MFLLQDFHRGLKQTLDTFISEEAILLAKFLKDETDMRAPRLILI